ncbi:tetratricopeptide repeat protein [Pseudoduganella chitinolytica]|uniref:Tetratricopeptide repeat protein n=1 Tax=Pseudoduganella chitinolytica TaxID=34070 RepID=A0ABY8BHE8_9BURK|nr:tetratricopeptide repeat protein [Pseudoduganella chitinolytica]WEF34793.1 tetratricopeptide repeat protein [Pseudoduganella chitinolytica]
MSLLMQALKKAERARQNGLPEEAPASPGDWGLEPLAEAPDAGAPAAGDPAAHTPAPALDAGRVAVTPPAASHGGPELHLEPLSLEPLDPAPRIEPTIEPTAPAPAAAVRPPEPAATPARAGAEPRIPLEPAAEAVHDPVPPQARHERARAAASPPAAPRTERKAPDTAAAGRADAAAIRAAAAARARAAANTGKAGMDMARVRVVGLSGILLVMLGTFGYVYWRATTAPGPGAALPMVPMPPPSATGATGIAVAPADAGSGLPVMATAPTGDPGLAQPAPALPSTTPPAPAVLAPVPAAVPAQERPARTPVLSGPVVSDDPAIMQAAQQDMAERLERAARERTADTIPATPAETPPPATTSVPASASANGAAVRTGAGDVRIARGSAPAIAPAVQSAYAAFIAGDLADARQQYEAALRQDPNNRDALLGSAAVAQRDNRAAQAVAAYARLLELDPQDPDALAGLVALRPGDMARSEAKLREMLKSRPDAGPVQFALGNLYARQGRWPEAQQAYFRAFTAAPGNADYAFNLAVGLDRLNQAKLAASYYEQSLALPGPAAFDRAAAQRRLRELAVASVPAPPSPAPAVQQVRGN